MTGDYQLHERLAADTLPLGTTNLCDIRLMNDATWPWVLLVPRLPGIREIYQLPEADQIQLLRESSRLGQGMMAAFGGDKFNLAALGNMVPQLHLHHIVRYRDDPAWPGPIWGRQAPVAYSDDQLAATRRALAPVLESLGADIPAG